MRPRTASVAGSLARLGFVDARRAAALLATPTLAPIVDDTAVLEAIGAAPDPDLALLGLDRLLENVRDPDRVLAVLERDSVFRRRLFGVLGMSAGIADHLARHPEHWSLLADLPLPAPHREADDVRGELLRAVGADPDSDAPAATLPGGVDLLRVGLDPARVPVSMRRQGLL